MDNKINELKKNLPKESCSFCTHLSLDGPDENLKYNVKCVIFDSLPKCNDNCEYFEPEYSGINSYDLDGLECEYPLFSIEDREKLKQIVKKYNKYMSGGTDYHAKNKPTIEIGLGIDKNINIDKNLIEDWINKVKLI